MPRSSRNSVKLSMQRDLKIVRTFVQPPKRVWRALTDSRELASWMMENDFVAESSHPFTFRMKAQRGWDCFTHCEVTTLEPQRRLAYTYRGHATGEKPLHCAGVESKVADRKGRGIFFDLDTESLSRSSRTGRGRVPVTG